MNIIQLQDNLKNLSDQQLTQAIQMPSQDTPPYLVVSELNRRKKMRDSFQAQQADQDKTTVAQDVVAAAGVPQEAASQMAQSLAPQTDMTNNTGIMSIPQQGAPMQSMADGGRVTKMAEGTRLTALPTFTLPSGGKLTLNTDNSSSVTYPDGEVRRYNKSDTDKTLRAHGGITAEELRASQTPAPAVTAAPSMGGANAETRRMVTPVMPIPSGVLTDPILISLASRQNMSVNSYLMAMDPEARQAAISRAAARGNRDIGATLDYSQMANAGMSDAPFNPSRYTEQPVNPSYEEQTTSIFPPDPEPIQQRPDFENYGREGAPTMGERVYAAQFPSLDDIIANDQAKYNNRIDVMMDSLPNMGERPPQWEDFYSANAINAVRPAYISGNAPINMGVVPEAAGT
ncbi:hypothetical protein UFOVP1515_75, partial [uncultured Caudovirales phage]